MKDDVIEIFNFAGRRQSACRYGGPDGRRIVTSVFEIRQILSDKDAIPPKKFVMSPQLYRDMLAAYGTYFGDKNPNPTQICGIDIIVELSREIATNVDVIHSHQKVVTKIDGTKEVIYTRRQEGVIDRFREHCFFLSNFYTCNIEDNGVVFRSAEHLYQAYKAKTVDAAMLVRGAPTPSLAKRLGRAIPVRDDWEQIKLSVMLHVVRSKFLQNKGLADLLVATDPMVLVEGNTHGDRFWGTVNHEGQNHLGRILMAVRQDLKRMQNA